MEEAETAAVLAYSLSGMDYPAGELEGAWKKVLFGQFHDILPGSCVPDTRHYQLGLFQEVAATTGMIKTNSLRTVAGMVDTSFGRTVAKKVKIPFYESVAMGGGIGRGSSLGGISVAFQAGADGRPFVIFTPSAWSRSEVVTATLWETGTGPEEERIHNKEFVVSSADGKKIPGPEDWPWRLLGSPICRCGISRYRRSTGICRVPDRGRYRRRV